MGMRIFAWYEFTIPNLNLNSACFGIHKSYFIVNVGIKAFLYTKNFDVYEKIFFLKVTGSLDCLNFTILVVINLH